MTTEDPASAEPQSPNGEPPKPFYKRWWFIALAVVVVIILFASLSSGDDEGEPTAVGSTTTPEETTTTAEETTTTPEETTTTPEETTTTPEETTGTRENPLPVGSTAVVGEWEVTIDSVNTDATDVLMAENDAQEIPEGRQPVMWQVTATYIGDETGDPQIDLAFAIVTAAGNTIEGLSEDTTCLLFPDRFSRQGETFPDATVTGNECLHVPSDAIEGATIQVDELITFTDENRVYFSLE